MAGIGLRRSGSEKSRHQQPYALRIDGWSLVDDGGVLAGERRRRHDRFGRTRGILVVGLALTT
jgi:hypothetical protein